MQKKLSHPKNSRRPSRATNSPDVWDVIVSWYSPPPSYAGWYADIDRGGAA